MSQMPSKFQCNLYYQKHNLVHFSYFPSLFLVDLLFSFLEIISPSFTVEFSLVLLYPFLFFLLFWITKINVSLTLMVRAIWIRPGYFVSHIVLTIITIIGCHASMGPGTFKVQWITYAHCTIQKHHTLYINKRLRTSKQGWVGVLRNPHV